MLALEFSIVAKLSSSPAVSPLCDKAFSLGQFLLLLFYDVLFNLYPETNHVYRASEVYKVT